MARKLVFRIATAVTILGLMLMLAGIGVAVASPTSNGQGNCIDSSTPGWIKEDTGGTSVTLSADNPGDIINSVSVKGGSAQSTEGEECTTFTQNGSNGCYSVSGLGTGSVTVDVVGSGPGCKEISHLEGIESTPTDPPDECTGGQQLYGGVCKDPCQYNSGIPADDPACQAPACPSGQSDFGEGCEAVCQYNSGIPADDPACVAPPVCENGQQLYGGVCKDPCQYNSGIPADDPACQAPACPSGQSDFGEGCEAVCQYNSGIAASDPACQPPGPGVCQYNSALPADDPACVPPQGCPQGTHMDDEGQCVPPKPINPAQCNFITNPHCIQWAKSHGWPPITGFWDNGISVPLTGSGLGFLLFGLAGMVVSKPRKTKEVNTI